MLAATLRKTQTIPRLVIHPSSMLLTGKDTDFLSWEVRNWLNKILYREHLYLGERVTPVSTFWQFRVLGITDRIEDQGEMRWEILGCLALAWLLVWLIVCRGPQSSGKGIGSAILFHKSRTFATKICWPDNLAAWVTALYPYVILTTLLIRAVTLPGAIDGIKFYLKPDFSKLLETEVIFSQSNFESKPD